MVGKRAVSTTETTAIRSREAFALLLRALQARGGGLYLYSGLHWYSATLTTNAPFSSERASYADDI